MNLGKLVRRTVAGLSIAAAAACGGGGGKITPPPPPVDSGRLTASLTLSNPTTILEGDTLTAYKTCNALESAVLVSCTVNAPNIVAGSSPEKFVPTVSGNATATASGTTKLGNSLSVPSDAVPYTVTQIATTGAPSKTTGNVGETITYPYISNVLARDSSGVIASDGRRFVKAGSTGTASVPLTTAGILALTPVGYHNGLERKGTVVNVNVTQKVDSVDVSLTPYNTHTAQAIPTGVTATLENRAGIRFTFSESNGVVSGRIPAGDYALVDAIAPTRLWPIAELFTDPAKYTGFNRISHMQPGVKDFITLDKSFSGALVIPLDDPNQNTTHIEGFQTGGTNGWQINPKFREKIYFVKQMISVDGLFAVMDVATETAYDNFISRIDNVLKIFNGTPLEKYITAPQIVVTKSIANSVSWSDSSIFIGRGSDGTDNGRNITGINTHNTNYARTQSTGRSLDNEMIGAILSERSNSADDGPCVAYSIRMDPGQCPQSAPPLNYVGFNGLTPQDVNTFRVALAHALPAAYKQLAEPTTRKVLKITP